MANKIARNFVVLAHLSEQVRTVIYLLGLPGLTLLLDK